MPASLLFPTLALLAALFFGAVPAACAGDAEDATAAVNAFYAEYIAMLDAPNAPAGNAARWVARSPRLTPEFKAAYVRANKKGFEADPILNAQDWDPKGVRVTETKEIDAKAGVLKAWWVEPGFSEEPFYVHVRKADGRWMIQRINGFGGPVPASARKYMPERGAPDRR